jgi:hypothetical protein
MGRILAGFLGTDRPETSRNITFDHGSGARKGGFRRLFARSLPSAKFENTVKIRL